MRHTSSRRRLVEDSTRREPRKRLELGALLVTMTMTVETPDGRERVALIEEIVRDRLVCVGVLRLDALPTLLTLRLGALARDINGGLFARD